VSGRYTLQLSNGRSNLHHEAMTENKTKRIKVLHLIKSLGRGGAEKLIPETALVHDQSNFEFHCLYFYYQKNNIVDELEASGITVHLIPSSNFGLFFQVKKVRDFIQKNGFDILHAHLPWAGILARFVGKQIQIPIVYTEHNTWERYNKVSYFGNRFTFKQQDIAIAVSNEVALSMQLNSFFDPYQRGGRLKIKVIQNGVNTDVFRRIEGGFQEACDFAQHKRGERQEALSGPLAPGSNLSLKTQLGIPEAAPVIGKVAVFRSQKRLWLWLEVALAVLKECPEVHFLLVGDGEWRDRILDQIDKSGMQEHFHWVGVQKQVIPYLSIMDIYMSSSEFEGLPIAMLEAMSCEVPVVATRAGGIGEVIQDGVQGYLTEIEEWKKLADYCILMIRDADSRLIMAKSARSRVIEKFSMRRMVAELEEVYRVVLKR
jgi:glycosyltransferase involved in cell wall biosynthesis